MKSLKVANIVAAIGFGTCALFAGHKVSVLKGYLAENRLELLDSAALAFDACLSAWTALVACALVACVLAVVNLLPARKVDDIK